MPKRGPKAPVAVLASPGSSAKPQCPGWLQAYGKRVWRRLVAHHPGTITASDEHLLAAYCQAAVQLKEGVEQLTREGYFQDSGGVNHAAWMVSNASKTLATLGDRLGLTPARRPATVKPDEDWEGLLRDDR